MNPDCNTVYFSIDYKEIYKESDVIVPIWFKSNAYPKYICYCNKVTEEEIEEAILKKSAKDMKDIIRITGAMKNAKCSINNPLGKCCGKNIEAILDRILK